MRGEGGQALVVAVLAIGIAAVMIVGLRSAQDRILSDARERRAGEAAVEAAGAALADAQLELLSSDRDEIAGARRLPSRAELDALVANGLVVARVRAAADALARANAGGATTDLTITVVGREIAIDLALGAHRQRASIESRCCRP